MNDTIYRHAAIDAIEKAKTARTADGEIYVAKINAEMNIVLLPSAQSENMDVNLNIQKITKHKSDFSDLDELPSAQSETSRIENALHGKSPEEQYDFIWWLMQDYGMQFTATRAAIIEWLKK